MIEEYNEIIFERIKHIDEYGNEYWDARELQNVLEYKEWRNFKKVIDKAIISCVKSQNVYSEHFVEHNKTIPMPKNAEKIVDDYKLSRYACYLIVQNGNPKKKAIALGQTYFAVQTRKQEISEEEYSKLNEDEKDYIRENKQK